MNRRKRVLMIFVILFCLYVGTYLEFRRTHIQVSASDRLSYVIFPEDQELFYYIFRPLSYIDSRITDMRFHIGLHR